MKNFLKKNAILLILSAVAVVCLFLGTVSKVFLIGSSAIISVVFGFLAIKLKKRYKAALEYDESDDYFDARSFDYEEDIYYVGTTSRTRKQIKGKLGSFEARVPYITCLFVSVFGAIMSIYMIIRLFV